MAQEIYNHNADMTLPRALKIYEDLRAYKPKASPRMPQQVDRLTSIIDQFDALFLDGFGVLNIGANPVPQAGEMLRSAQAKGVEIIVLTNGASKPSAKAQAKYSGFGFDLEASQIVSSRDALIDFLENDHFKGKTLGVIDSFTELDAIADITLKQLNPDQPDDWTKVDAIGFFGAVHWSEAWQNCLEKALIAGIVVYVANPDVTAPNEDSFTFEPGYWASAAAYKTQNFDRIKWFGKPHAPVFDLALKRLEANTGRSNWNSDRIAMVGDSLHTDILGGQAAGFKTVLITGHGLFRDGDVSAAMKTTGIYPDFIAADV